MITTAKNTENNNENFVVLGKILAPYGVKGWNHFRVFADDPLEWLKLPTWWLIQDKNDKNQNKNKLLKNNENLWQNKEIRQKNLRQNFSNFIIQIENCNDRNLAETYAGLCVAVPIDALKNNDKNEFYWAELLGMNVVIKNNQKSLGNVVQLLETGANDVLCVAKNNSKQQYLLPFVESVILNVDKQNKQILVDWNEDWL